MADHGSPTCLPIIKQNPNGFSDLEITRFLISKGWGTAIHYHLTQENHKELETIKDLGYLSVKRSFPLNKYKAIIVVKSLRFKNGTHSLYWNKKYLFDPSPKYPDIVEFSDYTILSVTPLVRISDFK